MRPHRFEGFCWEQFQFSKGRITYPNGDYMETAGGRAGAQLILIDTKEAGLSVVEGLRLVLSNGIGISRMHYENTSRDSIVVYEGYFNAKGQKEKLGKCKWLSTGCEYEGSFMNDVMHGKGKFKGGHDEPFIDGEWDNGVKIL
jgi:hypothetical protein